MDRTTLIGALRRRGGVAQGCAVALEGGSEFQVFEGTTPASQLATIYRRRAEHVRSVALDHGGFDDVVTVLDDRETGEVLLGQVTDRLASRRYALFLSPDGADVLCCLWVHHHE